VPVAEEAGGSWAAGDTLPGTATSNLWLLLLTSPRFAANGARRRVPGAVITEET